MLFISENPETKVIRSEVKALYDDKGRQIRQAQRRLSAKFQRGMAPAWAQKIGEETFEMLNRPPEVPAGSWLAAFDTEAGDYNEEERAAVEARLLERPGILLVEKPRLPVPYPLYEKHRKVAGRRTLEHAIADITNAYETAGFNIGDAIAYEAENENSPEVIAALEALVGGDTDPETETETLIAA